MDLHDRVALVTGGHRRVGRAIAEALASVGCEVHLTYLSRPDDANATVGALETLGAAAHAHQVDLEDAEAVEELARRVWNHRDQVDVLINSAAIFPAQALEEISLADWDRCQAINLKAPFILSRALGLKMKARGQGNIVNIGDWATERPYPGYLPYMVSKAGLTTMTRALALELAPQVRVNCVAPGAVLLPEDTSPEERNSILEATPLSRIGTPADVAQAVLFLVGATNFATGTILHVDGGRHLTT